MAGSVVVVGGTLAGMAVAARLAKAGHAVTVYEASGRLGGRWSAQELGTTGVQVDEAPGVISFPAPWRDLFRKSGRPLEAELARTGHALVPAEPLLITFADGTDLVLPTDRGDQYAALSAAYGSGLAGRWRGLLDRLDDVWQILRPLGLERELPRRRLPRVVRDKILAAQTVADLAAGVGHPHLAALLRATAYRLGSPPERTPAFVAVELATLRTFGRWRIDSTRADDVGRSSVLTEALGARLATRRVEVQLETPVSTITEEGGRVTGVMSPAGPREARAVVLAELFAGRRPDRLRLPDRPRLPRPAGRSARLPQVSHDLVEPPATGAGEHLRLSELGVPVVDYHRPTSAGWLRSRHDWTAAAPDPAAGPAWSGFGGWHRRVPVTTDRPGLYTAGPFSPGGPSPSAVLLSAALAARAVDEDPATES